MSCIEKMIIQGIRSFGPSEKDKQMITFFTPLTLILGPNGTGKTTIIECLKYITTGDMPPGATKNAAFIHDPKVVDETEVNAQIRLQFRSVQGQLCYVTRSVKAIQKARNIQMKTLEGVLTRRDLRTGRNISISSKCSELDNEMVNLLGVAKPILDSVIFCHQEDSNWPLSEGKVLKTKFDDIFASTRYVRALESIRKTAKDQDIEIKLCQNDIRFLKQNRDKSKQLQADLEEKTVQYEVACDEIQTIQKKIQPIIEQLEKLKSKRDEIYEIHTKIEKIKTEQKQISKSMADLKANIKNLFSGSTDELKQELNDFESELLRKKECLDKFKQQIEICDKKITEMNEKKASLLIELHLLKDESQRYEDNKQMRNKQIVQLAEKYRISGYAGKLSDSQVQEFVEVMNRKKTSLKQELQRKKADLEMEEEVVQTEIDQLRKKQTKLETELVMKTETKSKNVLEIKQIKQKLNSMEASGEHLKLLRRELELSEEELKESEGKLDIQALQAEVQTLTSQKKELESKLKSLDEELNQLTHESSIRSRLTHLEKDRAVKNDSFQKQMSSIEDSLTHLLGSMPKENLRKQLEQCLSKLSSQRSKTGNELQKLKQEKTKNETQLNMFREQLRSKEAEINKYQDRLSAVSGSDNFDDGLEKLQAELRKAQDEKGNLEGIQYMYKKYQDTLAKDDPPCPLCHRPFDSRDEVDELVTELEKKMSLVPSKLERVCSKIEKNKKKVEELIQLKPVRESMLKLQEEIPKLKEKIHLLRKQIDSLEEEINEKEDEFAVLSSDEQTAQNMQGDVQLIDKLKLEIQNADREIQQLSSKLSTSDNSRSIQDVQDNRSSLQDEIELISRKLERKQKKINDDLEHIQKLRATINTKRSEVIQIEQDLHQQTSLEEKRTALEQSNRTLDQEIKHSRFELQPLCGAIKEKEKQKEQITLQKEKENEEGSKQMNRLTEEIQKIIQYNQEIERYLKEGKNEQMKMKEAQITKVTQDVQKASERKNKLIGESDQLKDDISTNELRKREMSDNLQLHEKQKEKKILEQRIQKLTEELGGLDVDNLMKEQQRYEAEYDKCRREKSQADSRRNRYEEGIHFLKRELNDEAYKDAEKKYRERMIDLKTIEQAKLDLNKYYKALDKTIMRYHYNKMAEINKIIRQLWVNTYKGNDIETIEICFDDDDEGIARQKTRRTFNYRVVMIKNGVAVDMRNRCSAGQKVLASIIIRLALAECFCINCGVLALDEPTTNLDRENIESLAQALVEIIKTRSRQRNFQLIIITHDEDFVELLGRSEYVDEFFKVRKSDSGYSELVKARVEQLHSR